MNQKELNKTSMMISNWKNPYGLHGSDKNISALKGLIKNISSSWLFPVSHLNPLVAKLSYFIFHPLEVVSRYRDPQLQVGGNYSYSFNSSNQLSVILSQYPVFYYGNAF